MKITFLTLFPKLYQNLVADSIIKRAIDSKKVEIEIINFRDFAKDKNKTVDDYPYGGGAGMVLKIEPIVEALKAIKTKDSVVYLMSPKGMVLKQQKILQFLNKIHIILIAGHYEGFDARIENYIDGEISIGDYILTGGELPSMVLADAIIRLIPGVIKEESHQNESFSNLNLLEHSHFTRPEEYEGYKVPEVLLSGNHKAIDEYRKIESYNITKVKRPDLLKEEK